MSELVGVTRHVSFPYLLSTCIYRKNYLLFHSMKHKNSPIDLLDFKMVSEQTQS